MIRVAALLPALLLAACAQTPVQPESAAAKTEVPDEDRVTFFIHHARGGETAEVAKELDAGVAIDGFDSLGQNALIAAVSHNYVETVKLLLDRGADPNLADPAGWTPLIHATYAAASPELLQLLIDRGAKVDARNDRGITALYLAAGAGREDQVRFLLSKGADPKLVSTSGYTPVRIAQLKGLDRIVALLEGREPPALKDATAPVKGATAPVKGATAAAK